MRKVLEVYGELEKLLLNVKIVFSHFFLIKLAPAMVVLSYTPENATKTNVWVGKGIMYDTGGLSLKGGSHMAGMKRGLYLFSINSHFILRYGRCRCYFQCVRSCSQDWRCQNQFTCYSLFR
jgi:hypothetical protein